MGRSQCAVCPHVSIYSAGSRINLRLTAANAMEENSVQSAQHPVCLLGLSRRHSNFHAQELGNSISCRFRFGVHRSLLFLMPGADLLKGTSATLRRRAQPSNQQLVKAGHEEMKRALVVSDSASVPKPRDPMPHRARCNPGGCGPKRRRP